MVKVIRMLLDLFRGWYARLIRSYCIAAYLSKSDSPRLNIGCGSNLLSGWLNTDIDPRGGAIYLNGAKRFPLPDNHFESVFCEHVLEHLSSLKICCFLRECFRVLKPGCVIRIATPDLDFFLEMMAKPNHPKSQQYLNWFRSRKKGLRISANVAVLNSVFYEHGHRHLVNYQTLAQYLEDAGFRDVRREAVGFSSCVELCSIEGHGRIVGEEINCLETLVIEAIKP